MTTPDDRLTAASFRFAQAARAMHDEHCSCASSSPPRPCALVMAYGEVVEASTAEAGDPPTTDPDRPPPTIDGITLTAEELDELTAWSRASSRGGFRVWLEHDTVVEAATRIVATRLAELRGV